MNPKAKTIYIAGPMRGIAEFNFPAFYAAEERARALGFVVHNPARMDEEADPATRTMSTEQASAKVRLFAERDTAALLKCTHIALLPGWQNSKGATAEYFFARWIGLKVLDAVNFEPYPSVKHGSMNPSAQAMLDSAQIRNGEFVVKDSGSREQFATGAVRDSGSGKGYFHCLPYLAIERLAQLYEAGAKKYGKHNWRKGLPLSRFVDSMQRHALKLSDGWTDEDHATAVMWNAAGFIWTEAECKAGRLPAELLDVPPYTTPESN